MLNIITTKLLDTGIFESNEYLMKYSQLILDNQETKYIPFETQRHHIIPKYYFKRIGELVDDSKSNLVNLRYCDHILAHYYLAMCSINGEDKYSNLCGVRRIIRGFSHREDEQQLLLSMPEIQKCYEESKHSVGELHKHSDYTKKKLSDAIAGRVSIRDVSDEHQKYVHPEELQKFLDDGWVVSHNKQTDESRKKISEKQSGRVRIKRGSEEKSELSEYLQDGWVRGILRDTQSAIKGKRAVCKDGMVKYINIDQIESYTEDGWELGGLKGIKRSKPKFPMSDASRKNKGNAIRGKTTVHKDAVIKFINKDELDDYLKDGWLPGSGRKSPGARGKIWITNGDTEMYIHEKELEIYITLGWKRGRTPKCTKGKEVVCL